MRRVLVVLLGLGLAVTSGAADRPRPPGAAAAPSPIRHKFDPYTYGDQVFCAHVEERDDGYGKVHKTCGRPEGEHPPAQVGGDPVDEEAEA